jgi:plastocyanin
MNLFVRCLSVAATIAVAAACGGSSDTVVGTGGGGGGGGVTPTSCTTGTFCLGATTFVPTSATVARNATVTWVNSSGIIHNVVFDNPPAAVAGGDLGTMDANATASRSFATAGVYAFHCTIHAGMNGSLTVQ